MYHEELGGVVEGLVVLEVSGDVGDGNSTLSGGSASISSSLVAATSSVAMAA